MSLPSATYKAEWLPKVQLYRQRLADSIPKEYLLDDTKVPEDLDTVPFNAVSFLYNEKLLSEREFAITDLKCETLAAKIAASEYSSVEVLKAFTKRAVICHQLTHFATEFFFDQALERAAELDAYLERTGSTVGPFHGLPISLKDELHIRGKVMHLGNVSRVETVSETSHISARVLEELGAVFFVRTNIPQAMLFLDGVNNLTGRRTTNPINSTLTTGGSSSGEAVSATFRAAALSVGTDMGGSIRLPAAFSGCLGFKPTGKRIANGTGYNGQDAIQTTSGPMSKYPEDLQFFMKHYINDGKPWTKNASLVRVPWITGPASQKLLKVGIMYDDGVTRPLPAIERGLRFAAEKLDAAADVEVVEFFPIKPQELLELGLRFFSLDDGPAKLGVLAESNEPLFPMAQEAMNGGGKEFTASENRELTFTRDAIKDDFNNYMVEYKIDVILTAVHLNVATVPQKSTFSLYTLPFNVLDMPAVTIQTGLFQDPAVDVIKGERTGFRSDMEKTEWSGYNAETHRGAPIGVQLIGKRFYDEELLNAAIYFTSLFK
ncbi:hypothetical protein BABINDRAFT_163924 [Babjeviella inositovora NRRL Y-12698]|uniref:Amidase domain-containing protein n=1 Tax=Babjeviella inositovora NRRL Y-12698 TaxID=984486 RepID=A0A1E3QHC2_9ASCO|nr:uncharacterized protein BABINDRAFT_163924 [Babjeviella inositovora NRRL Y-12698]ODQ77030.1 hypothetical protein BABINDRAFT_163924 [Babjeviella inositovora NRRL Y-12698]